MAQEDKELLIKDICARLPYGVIAKVYSYWNEEYFDDKLVGIDLDENDVLTVALPGGRCEIDLVKPYLRPMSSMTEKKKKDLLNYVVGKDSKYFEVCNDGSITDMSPDEQDFKSFELKWINFNPNTTSRYIGWLLKNHFDICGLIPKGLALPAPKGMCIIDNK